jgi:threonine/homoserine/homoserine lactone efflux protein
MTPESLLAFAAGMTLLSLSPGPGLAAILSRTWTSGLGAGFAVTAGLVVGDFLFLGIAAIGLTAIATTLGPLFQIVKYAGALYLIWLGAKLFLAASKPLNVEARPAVHPARDVGMGLLVTLGNPKPILFYSALLPTFLDVTAIGLGDFLTLGAVVVAVSFAVYGGYMILAERSRRMLASTAVVRRLNQATGAVLVGSGIVVASRQ